MVAKITHLTEVFARCKLWWNLCFNLSRSILCTAFPVSDDEIFYILKLNIHYGQYITLFLKNNFLFSIVEFDFFL